MPTVLRSGPYRFFFFSGDRKEPQHVHVRREWREAKIWIAPVLVADGGDYRPAELEYIIRIVRENQNCYSGAGMSISRVEAERIAFARSVRVTGERLIVELTDGREISVPLSWYPRLSHGRPEEHQRWELIGRGMGIHWPDLDEDISVEGVLAGRRSGESRKSIARWLQARQSSGQ